MDLAIMCRRRRLSVLDSQRTPKRHTWENPAPQSHGSSLPLRRVSATKDPKTAELPKGGWVA